MAVLADFLRQRVSDLERDFRRGGEVAGQNESKRLKDSCIELDSTRRSLHESQSRQRNLDEEIAGLEAELADDRELLDMAAQQGGIGVAEAIRRNKRLKVTLRLHEREIERCHDEILVRCKCQKAPTIGGYAGCRRFGNRRSKETTH